MKKFIVYIAKKIIESKRFKKKYLDIHSVNKIGKDTYRITEAGIFNTYLFVGKDKALLVDTGIGIDGLLSTVKSITDLPLTVVVTHAHLGTIGGAGQFDKVYICKADLRDAKFLNKYKIRKLVFRILPTKYLMKIPEESLIKESGNFVKLPKHEEFDLGGRKIKIVHTPSHTRGSCCFVDSATKIIVTGGMTLPATCMAVPHSTTIEEYSHSLEKIVDELRNGNNYGSVGYKPISYDYTCDLKSIIDDICMYGNDYEKIIRFKFTDNKKRLLVYFPSKIQKRKLIQRIRILMSGM